MPPDQEAYRLAAKAIEEMAHERFGENFSALTVHRQELILKSLHDGKPEPINAGGQRMPVHRFWAMLLEYCVTAYYSHPWAWDEIGFGGPAYPRGYMRLENGLPEPWEKDEQRYEWNAPVDSLSQLEDEGTPLNNRFTAMEEATNAHRLGSMQTLPSPMRRFKESDTVDYCIVGVGSAGGVLVQRLARAGFRVVGLEAGPFWDTEKDWVSDEKGSHELYWNDLRITGGTHPLALGANNSGKGVGGGSVHWAAFAPRFHPSDFRVYTEDSVGFDWPMSYWDLKPYYELLEREIPVAGPAWFPWGDPHGHPYGPHPLGGVGDILVRGCTKLGIRSVAGGPVAILSASHGDRPHCIYRGFCLQGCKVGAKASTLITHVPDAISHGAEIRAHAMASRISLRDDGRADGVAYFDREGKGTFPASSCSHRFGLCASRRRGCSSTRHVPAIVTD